MTDKPTKNIDYISFLENLAVTIQQSRVNTALVVNSSLIQLYHHIGTQILSCQHLNGWGKKVIELASIDLKKKFPELKGFSKQNLKYMKKLALDFSAKEIETYNLDKIPWGHLVSCLYLVKSKEEKIFYLNKTIEHGWSRNILEMQIDSDLFTRTGKAITNFAKNLPPPNSDLAKDTLKNPYIFDFLNLGSEAQERAVEEELTKHIEKFLLELGEGFAFLGRQYHLEVEEKDFYLDLLFYHVKLKCYVVIELKTGEFKPEYAGKMNFYLSAVDKQLKQATDNPSIGLILCRSKLGLIAEYALQDLSKPIGLAEYKLTNALPENLKSALPSIEEIEEELASKNKKNSNKN